MALCVSRCVPIRIPFNHGQRQSENLGTEEAAERTRTNISSVVHVHRVLLVENACQVFGFRCGVAQGYAGVLALGSYLTSALWDSLAAYQPSRPAHGFEPTEWLFPTKIIVLCERHQVNGKHRFRPMFMRVRRASTRVSYKINDCDRMLVAYINRRASPTEGRRCHFSSETFPTPGLLDRFSRLDLVRAAHKNPPRKEILWETGNASTRKSQKRKQPFRII
jgi:hypothetical protein